MTGQAGWMTDRYMTGKADRYMTGQAGTVGTNNAALVPLQYQVNKI